MPAAEHIERQIAATITIYNIRDIISSKQPSLLMAMQRAVSSVEIDNDLLWWPRVRLREQLNEEPLNLLCILIDFVVARRQ